MSKPLLDVLSEAISMLSGATHRGGKKAYFGMASVLLIQACITLTKTLRDDHESRRLINRLDHAKTEKLLSDAASR